MSAPAPAVALEGITKQYGGLRALDEVSFSAYAGEVHALLGQNGCGKSTFVKVVTGFHTPDPGGRMMLWGEPVALPVTAPHEHGIAVIHQDLGLVEMLSVFDNMCVTARYGARTLGPIRTRRERDRCTALLADAGLSVDLDTPVAQLSPATRAGLAIARATRVLQRHGERFIFILDEPTTYLSADEAQRVIDLMRRVADSGSAVVFISHRLQEVATVADRITVLRDGRVVDHFTAAESDKARIVSVMLGHSLDKYYPDPPSVPPAAEPALRLRHVAAGRLRDLTVAAARGEIVGFAGLVGMGHEEVPYLIAGVTPTASGTMMLDGQDLTKAGLRERSRRGIALVPGNRQRDGAWLKATARENITLPALTAKQPFSPIGVRREKRSSATLMEAFGVRPPEPDWLVEQYSGGNQQKIVLAKWIASLPNLLVLDEPTQGVDAGAKYEVLKTIVDVANAGAIVLIASGDYEQLAHICNRVLVLRHGFVVAELAGDDFSEENLTHHAQVGQSRAAFG